MKRFIFRVDSSLEIGSGHQIRCRSLAYELRNQGGEIFFISKNLEGHLIKLIRNQFCTHEITSTKNSNTVDADYQSSTIKI